MNWRYLHGFELVSNEKPRLVLTIEISLRSIRAPRHPGMCFILFGPSQVLLLSARSPSGFD
jgi:hypothetical protein